MSLRHWCLALAVWMAAATTAAGQTTSATVQGTVRDGSGLPLPGVAVSLKNPETGFTRATTSRDDGTYVLTFVPVGTYTLQADLAGFRSEAREGLRCEIGQELTLDLHLQVASLSETVVVRSDAPLVETTKSTIDRVVTREQLDGLPLNGRQAASLALLAPGVVARGTSVEEPVTSEGQPRGSGETLVDGVSNELLLVNSVRSNAPPDAIEEFQVLTSQYQAEFGNASGLILNTITRSGTNTLHGRGYYFHRDEQLDARNPFATTEKAFEQRQGGGWLGGPIIRNRTHFFGSYEGTTRVNIATVTSPLAPGDFEQPFDNHQLLAKVDHQMTSNNRLTGRFSVDRPFYHNLNVGGINLEEVGLDYITEDFSYVGSWSSVLSNRTLNELRVQVSDARIQIDTRNPDAYTETRPSSVRGKFANQPQAVPELRFQVVENLTHEWGAHRFKVGVDINRITSDGYLFQNQPGAFTFATDRPFDADDLTTYPITFIRNEGSPQLTFETTGIAAFAQDAWRAARGLTLNVGVRYDAWSMSDVDLSKANVAPRFGVAWDPFGTTRTVIRGGFGVFYNNVMTNVPLFTGFLGRQRSIVISNPGYPDPFSRGVPGNPPLSTYFAEPNQPLPRSYNTTIGVQRELTPGFSVSADYVSSRGRKLIRIVDTNPVLQGTFTRPDPTRGFVRTLESTGYSNYDGLLFSVTKRFGSRAQVGGAYTLSSTKTTTEAENGVAQQDDTNKNDSYGYGNFDQRHRAVVNGTVTLPFGVQLAGVLVARSGTPFNITTGADNNRNQVANDRPNLAPGARAGTDDMLRRESFAAPGTLPGNLPRNAGRGPGYWQLDVRASKRFAFGATRLELLVEAFNLDNHTNLQNPIGNLASAAFGRSVAADPSRQVQLGVRFEF